MNTASDFFSLRPLQRSDAESMARYANNYNVWRNVRDVFPHPYSLSDAEQFIDDCIHTVPAQNFCMDYRGECIGVIGCHPGGDVYRKSAEIGYWIGEPFWGKGFTTMAVRSMADYIFQHFDIVRLYAGVFAWNPASMRVLEKAGFRFEGVFEKSVFKDGQLIDEYRYGLVKQ